MMMMDSTSYQNSNNGTQNLFFIRKDQILLYYPTTNQNQGNLRHVPIADENAISCQELSATRGKRRGRQEVGKV